MNCFKRKVAKEVFRQLLAIVFVIVSGTGVSFGADQIVTLIPSSTNVSPGDSFSISAKYDVSRPDGSNEVNILDMYIHWD